jgi:hypothetical protein
MVQRSPSTADWRCQRREPVGIVVDEGLWRAIFGRMFESAAVYGDLPCQFVARDLKEEKDKQQ